MKYLVVAIAIGFIAYSCKDDQQDPILPDPMPMLSSFTGEIGENDNSTITSNDNNLLICGNTTTGICLLKISKSGTLVWRRDIITKNATKASSIAQSKSNDIFISGVEYDETNILLVKTNSEGDTLWTRSYGGPYEDYGDYIISLNDGTILIGGRTCKTTYGDSCGAFLMKLSIHGDIIWTKTFIEKDQIVPYHLLQTQNDEILLTGVSIASPFERKFYLLMVSLEGSLIWQKTFPSNSDQWGSSTIELLNGDLITCGGTADTGYNQLLLLKTDSQGNFLWQKEYGETYLSEIGKSITLNADGTFTVTGGTMSPHTGQREVLILKIDKEGEVLVRKGFGHTFVDYGQNILKDDNDDNLITGQYNGSIFFTRTDNNIVFK